MKSTFVAIALFGLLAVAAAANNGQKAQAENKAAAQFYPGYPYAPHPAAYGGFPYHPAQFWGHPLANPFAAPAFYHPGLTGAYPHGTFAPYGFHPALFHPAAHPAFNPYHPANWAFGHPAFGHPAFAPYGHPAFNPYHPANYAYGHPAFWGYPGFAAPAAAPAAGAADSGADGSGATEGSA
eukprot:TRINITY_DN37085_c0_g1_i1.p1 TRINITY_DN37085_c0_g1~~TRINITY_DN37085_c0_g1_i1.p1  ORF type:complete len:181 (-),score=44.75 TRINITY_DN37085_c0_g1_i1:344-886(-)